MDTQEAVTGFVQSEKIKSALIWISQSIEVLNGLPEPDQNGAQTVIKTYLNMAGYEVQLMRKTALARETGREIVIFWEEAEKHIDMALVMLNSGMPNEITYHLTQALSQVTTVGQRAMIFLQKEGILA